MSRHIALRPFAPVAGGAVFLAACATYAPAPLANGPDLVAGIAGLRADASDLPFAPLKLHRFDPAAGLDPTDVAILAVVNSPDLVALRAGARVASAQAFAAGLLPDPQLGLNLDVPANPAAGVTTAYNLAPSLDLAGLIARSAGVRSARASAQQTRLDLLWAEWGAAQRARQLAETILAADEKALLLGQAVEALGEQAGRSAAASRRGDIDLPRANLDAVALLDAQTEAVSVRGEAAKARGDLNALLGLAPGSGLPLIHGRASPALDSGRIDAALASLPRRRPDLLALRAGYRAQDAALRKAILLQFPILNVGFSHQRDNSAIVSNGPSATLAIPIFNRGRGDIAIASATRERLAAEYQARLDQTAADVAAARRDRDLAGRELARLEAGAPPLQAAAARARAALAHGDVDGAAVLALEQAALKQRTAILDQRLALAMAELALRTALFLPPGDGDDR